MGESTAQERGVSYVPKCYKSQPFDTDTKISDTPIIDLAHISNLTQRNILVQQVANACRCHGFFQVINHGISQEILEGALSRNANHGRQQLPTLRIRPAAPLRLRLQIFDSNERTWMEVPVVHGALQVHVGDQLEVLSNGRYKSVLHRVVLSTHKPRISMHAMGMDGGDGGRESSFADFLDFISKNDLGQGRGFLDTLKIIEKPCVSNLL